MKSIISYLIGVFTLVVTIQDTRAQNYTTANAINNSGQIVGGMCVNDCNGFEATSIGKRGLTQFGTFGGPASVAFDVNDQGEVVGQSDTAEGLPDGEFLSFAFLANRDGIQNLGTLANYRFSQAFAINNAGLIIGRVYNSNPEDPLAPMRAVTFHRDGRIQDLGTLGGATSVAFGVSDSGQIVGRSRTANGQQHAFVYAGGVMKDLGTLGGDFSTARAVNSQGWIVGGSRLATPSQRHAFVVIQGVMHDLGTLGGSYSEAFAINGPGLVVGGSDTIDGELHAFVYSNGVMRDLGTLGGAYSAAFGVNDRGDIVGEAETADGEVHAFLYRDGLMKDVTP